MPTPHEKELRAEIVSMSVEVEHLRRLLAISSLNGSWDDHPDRAEVLSAIKAPEVRPTYAAKIAALANAGFPRLTPQTGMVLLAFIEARAEVVSNDRIMEYLDAVNCSETYPRTAVTRLRKRLPSGFKVLCNYGVGYRLIKPSGFEWPCLNRNAPAG